MPPTPSHSDDDFFHALGVERRYHLDVADLEHRFHELSRRLHPDRHVRSDPQTRVQTALATARLTQAYRTLRDPVRRANYLLQVEGFRIADESGSHRVSPAFLVEIMELREELAEARAAGDDARVRALATAVGRRRDQVSEVASAGFARYEAGAREALSEVADALVAERYFRRYLDEVEAFEEERERGERAPID